MKHIKTKCISCERTISSENRNKEHFFPDWLLKKADLYDKQIPWMGKRIFARSITIPICIDCNSRLGSELEGPVQLIFDRVEAGDKISDIEAELLVRWMWKFEGFSWRMNNIAPIYSPKYTLAERVLSPIDEIRPQIILAISRIKKVEVDKYGDKPMGVDWYGKHSGLFVSGVFSETAIMTLLDEFKDFVPRNFDLYRLNKKPSNKRVKSFGVGFKTDTDAVGTTILSSVHILGPLHEGHAYENRKPADPNNFLEMWEEKRRSYKK